MIGLPSMEECRGSPVATSQRRAVASWLAVASQRPSGLKAADVTRSSCLRGGDIAAPVAELTINASQP